MPIDYGRYPADWPAIRQRILARADDRCEWCDATNGAVIVRDDPGNAAGWRYAEMDEGLWIGAARTVRVVLTIAHLGTPHADGRPGDKHDKHDVRDENLAALCQRCHLLEDLDDHVRHAAETRRRRRIEAGQAELFGMEAV